MKRTITAMFDRYQDAAEAVRRLEDAGIPHSDISIVSNDPANRERLTAVPGATSTAGRADAKQADDAAAGAGTGASVGAMLGGGAGLLAGLGMLAIPGLGPVVAAGWLASTLLGAGAGAATGGLVGGLTGAGIDEADAHTYAEGIQRGGTLVTVRAEEAQADRVIDILDDEGTVNLEEREAAWRKEGWSGRHAPTQSPGATGVAPGSAAPGMGARIAAQTPASGSASTSRTAPVGTDREERIPITEEQLKVGKREVNQGRVRVRSYTVETPVNEQVSLREEHVSVQRRPVDRPVTGGDRLFQDRTIEVEQKAEEAVISKEARVKEELVINKDVQQRTQTVADKVRRTEVEVEDDRTGRTAGGTGASSTSPSNPSRRTP